MARAVLAHRKRLALALFGAGLTALSLGSGLGLIYPALKVLLDRSPGLTRMLQDLAASEWTPSALLPLLRWTQDWIPQDAFLQFLILLGCIAAMVVVSGVGQYLHENFAGVTVLAAAQGLRDRLFRTFAYAPYASVLQGHSAERLNHLFNDVRVVRSGLEALLGRTAAYVFKSWAALAVALAIEPLLVGVLCLGGALLTLLLHRLNRFLRQASEEALKSHGSLLRRAQDTFQSIQLVKTYGKEEREISRFERESQQLLRTESSMVKAKAAGSPAGEVMILFFIGAMAIVAAWLIFRNELHAAGFISVLLALTIAGQSLMPLARLTHTLSEAEAASRRLADVLESPRQVSRRERNAPSLQVLGRHKGSIVLEDLWYTYPGASQPALQGLEFSIRQGELVALAGSNGSGKTTLLQLLLRLIDPQRGRILIDGLDTRHVTLESLRNQIGFVPQDNLVAPGTIAENIRFGRPGIGRRELLRAAHAASAEQFISRCPLGFETRLGERGIGLSAGQSQRIALARALAGDPSLLILDEATSHADVRSSRWLIRSLQSQRGKRTVIFSSHSPDALSIADRVVLLDDGRKAHDGKPAGLIAGSGASPVSRAG